ncbi:unnamed protein product [Psylliodes chrysocephalus]|uniref:THAP-type domain-containing protein n=1 Tax=Psylliodes chrysocephalus TaxID=3402493 RepID=A0A9P0CGH1_9CUCU|nr:unnamed protein product [Psylliodes chrysocephala]
MVLKCCVPMCRGNYDSENKRHIFKFPKDTELIEKWVFSIPRENFVPSKYSAVCHIHFKMGDILWKTSEFDGKSGQMLTVNLLKPRLSATAVPSVFPNCPFYLSRSQLNTNRDSPENKKKKLEASALQRALEQSTSDHAEYIEKYSVTCLSDFKLKINLLNLNEDWSVIKKSSCVVILYTDLKIMSKYF